MRTTSGRRPTRARRGELRGAHRSDGGFTIVELVAAVAITSIIITTIGSAFMLGLRTTDETTTRLADSFDAQLVSRYLVPDVHSATSRDDRSAGSVSLNTGCNDSAQDVLRLVNASTAVHYELRTAGTTKELVRHRCDFSIPGDLQSVVVAHDLTTAYACQTTTPSPCISTEVAAGELQLVMTTTTAQTWKVSSAGRAGRLLTAGPPLIGPGVIARETRDDDGDGFVEKIVVTFDADVRCTGGACSPAAWPLGGAGPSGATTIDSVTVDGATATLALSGHSTTPDTSVPAGFTIELTAGAGGIEAADLPNLPASFPAVAPSDKAAPVLTALHMLDANTTNGKVDRVTAAFSETLSAGATAAPWTLTDVPSAGTKGSVSTAGSTATLAIIEGAGTADTAVGTFSMSLAPSSSGIVDAAGNPAQFSNVTPVDKAGPVPVGLLSGNGGILQGLAEQGDTVTVTFSEVLASAPPATSEVTLSAPQPGENKPVLLNIPGLSGGAFQIGETSGYLHRGSDDAVFSGSTLALLPDGTQVKLTLGAPSGGTRTEGAYSSTGVTPMSPSTALTDAAGNAATGSVTPIVRFF